MPREKKLLQEQKKVSCLHSVWLLFSYRWLLNKVHSISIYFKFKKHFPMVSERKIKQINRINPKNWWRALFHVFLLSTFSQTRVFLRWRDWWHVSLNCVFALKRNRAPFHVLFCYFCFFGTKKVSSEFVKRMPCQWHVWLKNMERAEKEG